MNIYNDFMNNLISIIILQYIYNTSPIWFTVLILLLKFLIIKIKKYYYIPFTNDFDLKNVVITYKNIIIFSGLINKNYYHINISYHDKYISIIGNNNYLISNLTFYRIIEISNKKIAGLINIIFLPIHVYPIEECCICYENEGMLVGLCGHQNTCKKCIDKINKCPVCNNTSICKYITIKNN